jgi:hypothetical protein
MIFSPAFSRPDSKIDIKSYQDLPFNLVGTINRGAYRLAYLNDSISGETERHGSDLQHYEFHLRVLGDSLLGKVKDREKYDLRWGRTPITGIVKDLRPPSWKMDARQPFYGFEFRMKIDTIPLCGLVTLKEKRVTTVDLTYGRTMVRGSIGFTKEAIFYDLKFGSKIIMGYRTWNGEECKVYLANLDSHELIAFLLIDLIYRNARYVPNMGVTDTPF